MSIEQLPDLAAADAWLAADDFRFLEFVSPTCGPCRMMEPALRTVATAYEGRVRFAKADIEQVPLLARRYGVRSTPTMLFLVGDRVYAQRTGALTATGLAKWVQEHVDANALRAGAQG